MNTSTSKLTYPTGTNETLHLTFDGNGLCTGRDKEQFVAMPNFCFAAAVADLGARVHPADERDRAFILDGLREYRDYLKKLVEETQTNRKPSHDLAATLRIWSKGITRLDDEIKRISKS